MNLFKKKQNKPPKIYYIELTNFCNFKCSMCNFHGPDAPSSRAKGFIEVGLAKSLIEQIAKLKEEAFVSFHGAGEPLMHKDLTEILEYAGKFENLQYGLLTNGMLLSKSLSNAILKSGIRWIGFSLDGIIREKFEKYRVGSDFERIMKNVLYFLDKAKEAGIKIDTRVNMTVQDEMKDDIDEFIDFWIERTDEVLISPCRPVGSRNNIYVDKATRRIPCYMLYEMMVIYWDGQVGLCCEDWFNAGNMGDLKTHDIISVWNGRRFNGARRAHERTKFHKMPLCKDCNTWFKGVIEEFFDERRSCHVHQNVWQHVYRKSAVADGDNSEL